MKLNYDKLLSTFPFKFNSRHYTAVVCETGAFPTPAPPSPPSPPTPPIDPNATDTAASDVPAPPTLYAGGRGTRMEMFKRYSKNNFDLAITGYAPDETTRLESFHTDILEVGNKYTARFTAFFTPRVTGNHTFWSQTDDLADVWVSEVEAGGTAPAAAGTAPGVGGAWQLMLATS